MKGSHAQASALLGGRRRQQLRQGVPHHGHHRWAAVHQSCPHWAQPTLQPQPVGEQQAAVGRCRRTRQALGRGRVCCCWAAGLSRGRHFSARLDLLHICSRRLAAVCRRRRAGRCWEAAAAVALFSWCHEAPQQGQPVTVGVGEGVGCISQHCDGRQLRLQAGRGAAPAGPAAAPQARLGDLHCAAAQRLGQQGQAAQGAQRSGL